MAPANTQALIAYYAGAYGPTVLIGIQRHADLVEVRRIFRMLASGELRQEDFQRALNARLDSLESFVVRSVLRRPKKTVDMVASGPLGPTFVWSNTPYDWQECALKVDPLIRDDSPGHQLFSVEGVDDALVELSYRE